MLAALGAIVVTATALAATGDLKMKGPGKGCLGGDSDCADPGEAANFGQAIAVTPDGAQVITGTGTNELGIYDRRRNGTLRIPEGTAGCISEDGGSGCRDGKAMDNLAALATSPDGTSIYAAAEDDDAIAVFTRKPGTGAVSQKAGTGGCVSNTGASDGGDPGGTAGECADTDGLDEVMALAMTPDGKHLYAAGFDEDTITVFDRNKQNGRIERKPGADGCVGGTAAPAECVDALGINAVRALVVSPDGKHLYSTGNSAVLMHFTIAGDGTLTQDFTIGGCIAEGSFPPCADGRGMAGPRQLAISGDGRTIYMTSIGNSLAVIEREPNGDISQPASPQACFTLTATADCTTAFMLDFAESVVASHDGRSVYVGASATTPGIGLYSRSVASGLLAQPGSPKGCFSVNGRSVISDAGTDGDCTVTIAGSVDHPGGAITPRRRQRLLQRERGHLHLRPQDEAVLGQEGHADGHARQGQAPGHSRPGRDRGSRGQRPHPRPRRQRHDLRRQGQGPDQRRRRERRPLQGRLRPRPRDRLRERPSRSRPGARTGSVGSGGGSPSARRSTSPSPTPGATTCQATLASVQQGDRHQAAREALAAMALRGGDEVDAEVVVVVHRRHHAGELAVAARGPVAGGIRVRRVGEGAGHPLGVLAVCLLVEAAEVADRRGRGPTRGRRAPPP